jgi:hypothetical protein
MGKRTDYPYHAATTPLTGLIVYIHFNRFALANNIYNLDLTPSGRQKDKEYY